MAHEKKSSGWTWIIGIVVLVLFAYVVSLAIPEEGTQTPTATQTAQGDTVTNTRSGTAQEDPMIVGIWKSNEDARFTREFRTDGTVTDAYEGDTSATISGTWIVVDPAKEPQDLLGAPAESLAGMTVLRLTFSDGQILYFGVSSVTESSLKLIYIGRGNTLTFTKVR